MWGAFRRCYFFCALSASTALFRSLYNTGLDLLSGPAKAMHQPLCRRALYRASFPHCTWLGSHPLRLIISAALHPHTQHWFLLCPQGVCSRAPHFLLTFRTPWMAVPPSLPDPLATMSSSSLILFSFPPVPPLYFFILANRIFSVAMPPPPPHVCLVHHQCFCHQCPSCPSVPVDWPSSLHPGTLGCWVLVPS